MKTRTELFDPQVGRRPGICSVVADALARADTEGGAVLLDDAIQLAVDHGKATGVLVNRDGDRYVSLWRRFGNFMLSVTSRPTTADVTEEAVSAFVDAWTSYHQPAGIATKHLRLSALRALFRLLRELHIASADPSIDIRLPRRTADQFRPFTDAEIELCRWHALATTTDTRRPAAWALMESGANTGEVGLVCVGHVDLDEPRLTLPGGPKTTSRTVLLNDWAVVQLRRRVAALYGDATVPLAITAPAPHDEMRNSATAALRAVIRSAGFGDDPLVGPTSITGWLARNLLAESGRIEVVARRLGVRSLDRAARAAHWDWTTE